MCICVPSSHRGELTCKQQNLCTPDSKVVGVVAPNKLQSASEALVTPRKSRVDDVLAISTYSDKAAVRVVLEGLRVQVAAAQILDS